MFISSTHYFSIHLRNLKFPEQHLSVPTLKSQKKMAAVSSLYSSNLLQQPRTLRAAPQSQPSKSPKLTIQLKPFTLLRNHSVFVASPLVSRPRGESAVAFAVAEAATTQDSVSAADRRLYIGNIPRNVGNDELTGIVKEHGAVEKTEVMYDKWSKRSRRFAFVTMKTVDDATAAIEKLNGTGIGGRKITVNVTEKPLSPPDVSLPQVEETQFVDSPYKVYVANLAKTVTTESLIKFFSEKGNVLSAKVSRTPGTSKSSSFGFVTFSSDEDVEAAISSFNDSLLEGQKIRVNKA